LLAFYNGQNPKKTEILFLGIFSPIGFLIASPPHRMTKRNLPLTTSESMRTGEWQSAVPSDSSQMKKLHTVKADSSVDLPSHSSIVLNPSMNFPPKKGRKPVTVAATNKRTAQNRAVRDTSTRVSVFFITRTSR
jgi:hypothetical protein